VKASIFPAAHAMLRKYDGRVLNFRVADAMAVRSKLA
jgi:hypothetical protein